MNRFENLQPEDLIGQTWCGAYSIESYRGKSRAGWFFVARRSPQYVGSEFGGGLAVDSDDARVVLQIALDNSACDRDAYQRWKELEPHDHLLHCLEFGESRNAGLAGARFLVSEYWDETLGQLLTRRSKLDDGEARQLASEVGAVLARCHAANQSHGELGLHNIYRVDGRWKLGLALQRTQRGGKLPQAMQGDVARLGLVLLRCLSPCFAALRRQNASSPVTRAEREQGLHELPEFWQHWLGRCLDVDPAQRCSAAELALMDAVVPSPKLDIIVRREGDSYRMDWQTSPDGAVHVFRWLGGRCPVRGEVWLQDDLARVAERLPSRVPTGTRVAIQPDTRIVVALVSGRAAVIHECMLLAGVPDVQRLKLAVEGNSLIATWDWPRDSCVAEVVIRNGAFPEGPGDPHARVERCFRAGYFAEGRFVVRQSPATGRAHVAVYALYRTDEGWERACGRTAGARAAIAVETKTTGSVQGAKKLKNWLRFGREGAR